MFLNKALILIDIFLE